VDLFSSSVGERVTHIGDQPFDPWRNVKRYGYEGTERI